MFSQVRKTAGKNHWTDESALEAGIKYLHAS